VPHEARDAALRYARATPMSATEVVAVAVSLVAVAIATRALIVSTGGGRVERFVLGFAVALPLLTVTVGLCHASRLRRGLRAWAEGRRD
jgi:hypothetical protein